MFWENAWYRSLDIYGIMRQKSSSVFSWQFQQVAQQLTPVPWTKLTWGTFRPRVLKTKIWIVVAGGLVLLTWDEFWQLLFISLIRADNILLHELMAAITETCLNASLNIPRPTVKTHTLELKDFLLKPYQSQLKLRLSKRWRDRLVNK